MLVRAIRELAVIGLLAATLSPLAEARSVEVEALLGKTAVLKIDGQRRTLRVGETIDGVKLVGVAPAAATLEIDGQVQEAGLSRRITSNFQQPTEQRHTITRDALLQYQTIAEINGRGIRVLVDTGANVVALSSAHARTLGIDFSVGAPARVQTASGVTSAYAIMLQSVSVGGIRVDNVPATVLEGDFPATVLLGMSYLKHVKLQEHNGILSLSRTP